MKKVVVGGQLGRQRTASLVELHGFHAGEIKRGKNQSGSFAGKRHLIL